MASKFFVMRKTNTDFRVLVDKMKAGSAERPKIAPNKPLVMFAL